MFKLPCQFSDQIEAGTDEAGRGCLAGPVTAAAVILPIGFSHPALNDSKKLSEKQRYELRPLIEEQALAFSVAHCSVEEIESLNILHASIRAMHKALEKLAIPPAYIAVDGNRFTPYKTTPHQCFIKGDGRFQNIAAASILAKTYRDDLMTALDLDFPAYQWKSNKGYPTKAHREAIKKTRPNNSSSKNFSITPQSIAN